MTDERLADEIEPLDLCHEAEVDPNEEVVAFTLEDYAAVLLNVMAQPNGLTHETAVRLLRTADVFELKEALLVNPWWVDALRRVALQQVAPSEEGT
jgi:hypothetical protein